MTRLVTWAGNAYFAEAMTPLGWQSVQLPGNAAFVGWEDVLRHCGRTPDLFIYGDTSRPPFLLDIEDWPCPTLWYAIDSHIHSWYPLYAQAFDLCCMSMRDHLPAVQALGLGTERTRWLPLFAKAADVPPAQAVDPVYDLLFVGKNDPDLTPGRFAFLKELQALLPPGTLTVRQGWYPPLYAQARVVLNVSEHGDLNFRVFEALGCGACLLTPQVGHGLTELFTPGRELFVYAQHSAEDAARRAGWLLENPQARREVALAGLAAVDHPQAGHRHTHRAAQLTAWLDSKDLPALMRQRREQAADIRRRHLRLLYLHHAEVAGNAVTAATYLAQARK